MNEANWEQEAKKQAAECGELKIKIAERLESVQKRISAREAARDDTETSMELFEILNRDLVNEEKWLTAILKEGGADI